MGLWMLVVGAGLLGLVLFDVLVTTVAPDRGAGPLTGRLASGWARAAGKLARDPRSLLLSATGPTVVVLTISTWLLLLWAGWTLVFSAAPSAVVGSDVGQPADGWARAYFAGFAVFTLGVGDYVPGGALWQVLSIVATISGLGLTTMAITYLVPVVSAATQRGKQANMIASLGDSAEEAVTALWDGRSLDYLDQFVPQVADGLLLTAHRHLSYPILHYFHPSGPEQDLRVQAPVLDDALSLIELGIDDPAARPHKVTIGMGRAAVRQLVERALARDAEVAEPAPPCLQPLREAGIPTVDDATFERRLRDLEGHRRAVAAYRAGSRWASPSA